MEINIEGVNFKRYEDFWLANLVIEGNETTFEINDEFLDQNLVQKILQKIGDETIKKVLDNSMVLLRALSLSFWGKEDNSNFTFSGFVIDLQDNYFDCDFKLCFHCYGPGNFSDFANWFTVVKDFRIIGALRQQL